MDIGIIEKIVIWIKNNWISPLALFSALLLTLIISLYVCSNYNFPKLLYSTKNLNDSITTLEIFFTFILLLIVIICWYINRKTPKAKTGTIGIAIAITCENEEEEKQIKSDFIDALDQLLTESKGKYPFALVLLPKHIVKKIKDEKSLYKARDNANCKFIIKGKVLIRGSRGEQTLIIDLSKLLMSHNPIDINSSQQLSHEMNYVMVQKYLITKKNELEELEITVHYINIATIYLIATVAQLSNDFEYTETLLLELDKKIKSFNNTNPKYLTIITKIRKILPHRLAALYFQIAYQYYSKWLKKHEISEIPKVKEYLDKSLDLSKNIYAAFILRSVCFFIVTRDANLSIKELNSWNGAKDGTWFYNMAFLYAYEGNLSAAFKYYNKAFDKTTTTVDVFIQVEEFINWLLTQEPDKVQLHFCIALINYYGKKDNQIALDEFKLFVDSADDRFETHKKMAKNIIEEITANT